MNAIYQRLMQNKHTSGAGLVYVVCEVASKLGAIWWPEHEAQFAQSLEVIQKGAIGYGFIMAGDSPKRGDGDAPPSAGPTKGDSATRITGLVIIGAMVLLEFIKHTT